MISSQGGTQNLNNELLKAKLKSLGYNIFNFGYSISWDINYYILLILVRI